MLWTRGDVAQLCAAEKSTRITGFNDPSISGGLVMVDLVDACKPGSIDYELVKCPTADDQVRFTHGDIVVHVG